jgi:hypothetical protein
VIAMRSFVSSRCATGGCSSPATRRISCRRPGPRASICAVADVRLWRGGLAEFYASGSADLLDHYFRERACRRRLARRATFPGG